jgi:hypothetical protein
VDTTEGRRAKRMVDLIVKVAACCGFWYLRVRDEDDVKSRSELVTRNWSAWERIIYTSLGMVSSFVWFALPKIT